MADTVSKLAAFVFENGAMADEIVFRDVEEEGEIPGLLPEEREAMDRATPLLRATWIGILSACRQAVWNLAAGHPTEEALRSGKTQPNKMWEKRRVVMPLVPGRANCGVALQTWGEPNYHLYVWVWTQVRPRPAAEGAVASLNPPPWRNEHGSFLMTLDGPREGEGYDEIGRRVAEALWLMARPIAEAVAAAQNGGEA